MRCFDKGVMSFVDGILTRVFGQAGGLFAFLELVHVVCQGRNDTLRTLKYSELSHIRITIKEGGLS